MILRPKSCNSDELSTESWCSHPSTAGKLWASVVCKWFSITLPYFQLHLKVSADKSTSGFTFYQSAFFFHLQTVWMEKLYEIITLTQNRRIIRKLLWLKITSSVCVEKNNVDIPDSGPSPSLSLTNRWLWSLLGSRLNSACWWLNLSGSKPGGFFGAQTPCRGSGEPLFGSGRKYKQNDESRDTQLC